MRRHGEQVTRSDARWSTRAAVTIAQAGTIVLDDSAGPRAIRSALDDVLDALGR